MPMPLQRRRCFFTVIILMAAAPAGLFAQWPSYPSPGVPKTADGKPNLNGPAPKTADGKPDLSGIWQNDRTVGGTVAARSSPKPPSSNEDLIAIARRSPFWNLGSQFPDGLPFTPWGAKVHSERVADNSKDNPDAHCLPMGIMQFHNHGEPRKMIQTPQEIVILYEANAGIRQIFTDGRALPDDPDPWWYGYSTGHWEGDTLVVETAGFRDMGWLDVEGSPLSDQGHITERYRRPDFGHLEIQVTINDPKSYTKPWTVSVHQHVLLDTNLIEFVCQENEQDAPHLSAK
jgi:hypothetical protein